MEHQPEIIKKGSRVEHQRLTNGSIFKRSDAKTYIKLLTDKASEVRRRDGELGWFVVDETQHIQIAPHEIVEVISIS